MSEEADTESRRAKSDCGVVVSNIFRRGAGKTSFRASYSCRSAVYNGDIKYGPREKAKPRSRTCGWLLPFSPSPVRLAKQGLPVLRGRARASRLIVWKMAYCLHLPTYHLHPLTDDTICVPPWFSLSLSNDPWDSFVTYYTKDTNRLSACCFPSCAR